jgi:curved DNA-binding protein CbpA
VLGSRDAYLVLQIHPSAAPEVVEAAYRALALIRHPDRSGAPDASTEMAELNWAYQTLRDPAQRAAYDRRRVAIPIDRPTASLSERMRQHAAAADEEPGSPAQVVLDFGRFAGTTLGELARTNPDYLEWLRRHTSGLRYRQSIDDVLASHAARRG